MSSSKAREGSANAPTSSLRIEPTSAYFPPPHHNRSIRNTLTLSNTSDASYVFKVRGVRGEAYQVKPTIFVIPPTSAVRLQLTLKKTDIALSDQTHKDRFRITCKKLKEPLPQGQTQVPDYRGIWEAHTNEPSFAELDVKCHFGAEVPRGVVLAYLADDAGTEVGSTAPTLAQTSRPHDAAPNNSAGGVPPLAPSPTAATPATTKADPNSNNSTKVKFQGHTAAPAAPTPAEDPASAKVAASNARKLRETVQQDIENLKKQVATHQAELAAERRHEDRMVNEALDLEELRRRAQDGSAKNDAQRAVLAQRQKTAGEEKDGATSVSPTSTAAGPLHATATAAAASSLGNNTSGSAAIGVPAKKKKGGLLGSMYLSTVLLWMIVAYLGGILYRVYLIQQGADGGPINLLQYFSEDIQEMLRPLQSILF